MNAAQKVIMNKMTHDGGNIAGEGMSLPRRTAASDSGAPFLTGARGWIVTDGKAGMVVQARGVADALGLVSEMKEVHPRGLWHIASPWGPVNPAERFGKPGSAFCPPWPDIAIATGRASIPYIRALRRLAGPQTYTVVLQDPKTGASTADLIWVPEHDRRRGSNVMTTLTAPHSYSPARLSALRESLPVAILALPRPLVTVVLGGKNGVYKFTDADDDRLEASLASLAALGASFLITPSRRTHRRLIAAAEAATRAAPRILWDGTGDNPYPHFLAAADALVVTADSVNMCGEACATGRPVYIFTPSGGSAKFTRFHERLAERGATRPLPDRFAALAAWTYAPLDSAQEIAEEIRRRFGRRRQVLPGPGSHASAG
ncbi:MAG: mitochondrial fission ELM1 family protein [Hyphomicrobiaceae bacterium]|nr:mitochondrial fission ELM1 family protein [Hyphomicrobiaceae bacterium]